MSEHETQNRNSEHAPIAVALASNSTYFVGLSATVVSLLRSNPQNCFDVHIIDGGLSGFQKRFLSQRVARAHHGNRITFHQLNAAVFSGFKLDYGNSYMTYARILISSLIQMERVIYLDCDLIIATDLRPLWELTLGDHLAAAAPDPTMRYVTEDYPFEGVSADARYFNAGVMLINLKAWRRANVQEKILRMIADAPDRFSWWDQTAMNVLFQHQVLFVDSSWNRFADSFDFQHCAAGGIFHYAGKAKPWTKYLDSVEFELWRAFYARHVRAGAFLLLNRKFLTTYLQYLRHRLLRQSESLKQLAIGLMTIKAKLAQKDCTAAIARFRTRHTASTNADRDSRRVRASELEKYLKEHWG